MSSEWAGKDSEHNLSTLGTNGKLLTAPNVKSPWAH